VAVPEFTLIDRLDDLVQSILSRPDVEASEPELAPLLAVARDLRDLPRENFKARLKADLERKTSMATATEAVSSVRQTATPRLRVKNAAAAIEFYKKAFGARELMRFEVHSEIAHAEIAIGNSVIMLGEEALDYGFPSPQTLGGSPVSIHLHVEDVDALVKQAIDAGARLTAPVQDQFYGDRAGSVADPFGYTWNVATRQQEMSVEEMHRRFQEMEQSAPKPAVEPVPKSRHTITPYVMVEDAPAFIDFLVKVFGAEEKFRAIGSAGGIHAEVLVADSMLMIGGSGPGLSAHVEGKPVAFHIYVPDVDAVYRTALDHGCVSIEGPTDQPWGERTANIRDAFGNLWHVATHKGESYRWEGAPTIQPYLYPLRSEPVINFLQRAFGAKEMGRHTTADGVIHHTTLKIGDSFMEMADAYSSYWSWTRPMESTFYLYVPDVDAMYRRALNAGATSTSEPADQSYGDRTAGVKDAFGNQWYIATKIQETRQ
jgi:PhnB protein